LRRAFRFEAHCLFQLKDSSAYNLTVDLDVDSVSAGPERAGIQIEDVLTVVDPEIRA
jgi:hypothetical protein